MTITITSASPKVVSDESSRLQNATATAGVGGDSDDNDILITSLPSVFDNTVTGSLFFGLNAINAALSGYTGAAGNTGADAFTVSPDGGGAITDVSFVDPDGKPLTGLDSGLLTVDGVKIFLYTVATNNNIVLGREGTAGGAADASGKIAFAGYIEETRASGSITGGKIWLVQYETLKHPNPNLSDESVDLTGKVYIGVSQDTDFSLAGAPSGQNLFLMFTKASPTVVDGRITDVSIVATGKDPLNQSNGGNISSGDTINTSQAGGPTTFGTNSQMITEQEGIRYSFVTGARQEFTIPNLDQNEADVESNIDFTAFFGTHSAHFDVVQLQSGKSAQVRITAYSSNFANVAGDSDSSHANESGAGFIDGYADDAVVAISKVTVTNTATGATIASATGSVTLNGIGFTFANGVVLVTGIKAGYTIDYTTTTDHNRVLIENGAATNATGNTHADFDIGGFKVVQTSVGQEEIGSHMVFEDDGPTLGLNTLAPTGELKVDESSLGAGGQGIFSGSSFFSPSEPTGTEVGAPVSSVYALELKSADVDSGLVDTLSGDRILLRLVGTDKIEGYLQGDTSVLAFQTTLNTSTGQLTLTQFRAVVHDNPADPIESGASAAGLSSPDLIKLTRTDTITDSDGDSASTTKKVDIGDLLAFEDDGPSIDPNANTVPTLTTDDTGIPATAGPNSFAGLFTTALFGNDGFKDTNDDNVQDTDALAYTLGVSAPGGVDSGVVDTLSGDAIYLYKDGNDVVGRVGLDDNAGANPTGAVAFRISVSAAGAVTLVQNRAVVHNDSSDPAETGQSAAGLSAATLVTLTATVTDGDGDTDTATRNIGDAFRFEDDGPSISGNATVHTLTTDDSGTPTSSAGPTSFADMFTSGFGKDGFKDTNDDDVQDADAITYALNVSAPGGVDSGVVDTLSGKKVFLFVESVAVVGRVGSAANLADPAGAEAFRISVVTNTGNVTLTQSRAVVHDNPLDPVESGLSAAGLSAASLVTLTATITDGDGDTSNATRDIGDAFKFEDDGPSILAKTDLIFANSSNPTPGGTGVFDYAIGADARLTFSSSNSDFSAITLTGKVGVADITNPTVTWSSETATSAVFNVQFSYQADPASSTTTQATGTLTFDKVNDTYSVALIAPISGFTVLTTGTALGFTGYTVNSNTVDQTQPDVSVAQLSSNFFVQFSGYSEPGGGTGANNIQAGAVDGTAFVNGELFSQAATWVSVSNTANGVAGDTIQKGEVLDLDFFNTNPTGFTSVTPTTQASGIFLKFDGIGSEDLVVVLKLIDPDDNSRTTKAIIIDNADILKFGATIPAGYGIVLDNNDGAVIIEGNDFNGAGQNYLIEGAQLLVSTEGVTGTAINLTAATGSGGASTTTQTFGAATTDNDVIKISDIGFVTANSGTLNTNLTFSLKVVDADGDATATQTLDVGIVGGTTFTGTGDAEAIQGSTGNDTINGGDGNDVLTGGLGKDTLTGAGGSDVFDFNLVAESMAGANRDIIVDFLSGTDKIDLTGIDANSVGGGSNDTFTYIGASAFSSVAGQLRFDAGTHQLQGDTDGNGSADFAIELTGIAVAPLAGDILV